jgi:hypothetical protein
MTEQVYISFREKETEKPWQLLRVSDPKKHHFQHPAAESFDPCAVDARRAPFYLEELAKRGYETTVTQLHPETKGVHLIHEQMSIANLLGFKPGDAGYTGDLLPPRRR